MHTEQQTAPNLDPADVARFGAQAAQWWLDIVSTAALLLKHGFKYDHSQGYRDFQPFYARVGDSWNTIDYSKTAKEWMHPLKHGKEIDLVDIAANCLDAGIDMPLIVTPLWDLPADLSGDFGVCCDVMEHIPTDKVDDVLSGIAKAVPRAWFHISSEPDAFGVAVGAPFAAEAFGNSDRVHEVAGGDGLDARTTEGGYRKSRLGA